EAAPHDLGERWRHLRRQWRRFVLQNRVRGLQRRIALEGSPTRKHFIQHGPYGKDIRAAVGGTSANLLGCHVTHRTEYGSGLRSFDILRRWLLISSRLL